jgi:hypothetical protein
MTFPGSPKLCDLSGELWGEHLGPGYRLSHRQGIKNKIK